MKKKKGTAQHPKPADIAAYAWWGPPTWRLRKRIPETERAFREAVDAVVDLVQSVEGSKDDAFIARTVETVRRLSGQEIADRLQQELDDKVRASSSSACSTLF